MAAGPQIIDRVTGVLQTPGATITTVVTFTMTPDTTGLWIASLIGRSAAGDGASASQQGACHKVGAAAAAIAGTAVTLAAFLTTSDAALVNCVITVDASGNTIRLRVTGIAATVIDWFGSIEMMLS